MIAIPYQELIEVSATSCGVVEIKSRSLELGQDVSFFIQPGNVEILCDHLLLAMKEAKDNALLIG